MQVSAANGNQEQTGSNGTLPDTGHDIYCVAQFHDDQARNNYYKSSCDIRLEDGTCFVGHACEHFIGEEPKRNAYQRGKLNPIHKLKRKKTQRMRTCKICGKKSWIKARNLCSKDYDRAVKAGTLENYPCARKSGATRKRS